MANTREGDSGIPCPKCGKTLLVRQVWERDRESQTMEWVWRGRPYCPDRHRIDWSGIAPIALD
jgi:ssDNA-binding Zn-finger/Zn-ribbon topoisomerase 1